MPREPLSYLALNGSLGTGFKESSLEAGLTRPLAFIGADSGSTDGGPFYLGSGEWIWSDAAYERDLRLGLLGARRLGVPLIIGSCGGGGNDTAVDGYAEMVDRITTEAGVTARVACVKTEPDRDLLVSKYRDGKLRPLPGAPEIDEDILRAPGHIVAMSGAEPIQDALDAGADVVLVGRCADAAIFAAVPLAHGFDPGPVWNAAKIVECGSAAAMNRQGQDCILCTVEDDGFVLEPLDPPVRCTPGSVAAHTLYETADPYRLTMPSGTLDARSATYEALDDRRVKVRGGTFTPSDVYTAKLEGAAPVGYLSSFWGSMRDPVILNQLSSWCDAMQNQVRSRLESTWGDRYRFDLKVYGANGTIGEPTDAVPREAVIVFDLVGDTQEEASGMARAAYHVVLHYPVKEYKAGSITTIAHPYSAPVIDRGQIYRFTLNHQLVIDDGERAQVFRTTLHDLGAKTREPEPGGCAVSGVANAGRYFSLIRSKDAGPFMLTIDLFFADAHSRRAFLDAGVFSAERIGALYGVDPSSVQIFDLADIDAMKISFPRPVVSGDFGDTDITGGQQYALVVDLVASLDIDGEGADLVVRVPGVK